MKYEIKQLNNTDAVVISDEEIKEGAVKEIYLEYISPPQSYLRIFEFGTLKQLFIQKNINIGDCGWRKKVIATISPYKIEGLPILELPSQEEDVERLALKMYPIKEVERNITFDDGVIERYEIEDVNEDLRDGFTEGYKAAQKQFSESDMINAFIEGSNSGVQFQSTCEDDYGEAELCAKSDLEYFKQSLQKKQFPTSVELTEDLQIIKWYYK